MDVRGLSFSNRRPDGKSYTRRGRPHPSLKKEKRKRKEKKGGRDEIRKKEKERKRKEERDTGKGRKGEVGGRILTVEGVLKKVP